MYCPTVPGRWRLRACDLTSTESSTKSGASRYSGSTFGQDCCMTSPPCLRRGLRGFWTWLRPGRKHNRASLTALTDKLMRRTHDESPSSVRHLGHGQIFFLSTDNKSPDSQVILQVHVALGEGCELPPSCSVCVCVFKITNN